MGWWVDDERLGEWMHACIRHIWVDICMCAQVGVKMDELKGGGWMDEWMDS